MMRVVIFWKATIVLLMLLVVATGCNGLADMGGTGNSRRISKMMDFLTGTLPTRPHGESNLETVGRF